jgi:hypothetical protein
MTSPSPASAAAVIVPTWLVRSTSCCDGTCSDIKRAGASVDAWPGTGHFPHLAWPADFARVLAETGAWAAGAPLPA